MNIRNSSDATEQVFSKQSYDWKFFAGTDCPLNGQIWQALMILLGRQSQGIQTHMTDLFPMPEISDRTRMLYIRLMVKRGFLNPLSPTLNLQSVLSLSKDTQDRFMEAGYLGVRK